MSPVKAFGGHLEPGTEIFSFDIVTIGIVKAGADFSYLEIRLTGEQPILKAVPGYKAKA